METSHGSKPNIFFFPMLARGHMIPTLGVAKLLAERGGVRATIVTTPGNASVFSSTIDGVAASGHSMQLLLIPFPDVGLPLGCENTFDVTSDIDKFKLFHAIDQLEQPLQEVLRNHRPDCLVGDINMSDSLPARAARSVGIRYVEFSVFSAFSGVVIDKLSRLTSHTQVSGTVGPLVGLPHCIEVTRKEMPPFFDNPDRLIEADPADAKRERPAVIINTFHELEPEYVELMKDGGRRKVWCVGPIHLDKIKNCAENDKNWEGTKKWLDAREQESVLYVSFGSECIFEHDQLRAIALGLESSLQPFIWVIRSGAETIDEWLPEGFREKVGGRGLVLTEWAPQTLILSHPAVGGSVVHCGWNSAIEAVGAGLPVIAWPQHSEQFFNERLFVEVLRTGVRVLDGEDMRINGRGKKIVLSGEKIKEAVLRLFGNGEEAKEMRKKAKEYGKLARSAMEEGGSSAVDIKCFVQELTELTDQEKRKPTAPISN